jgi:hypothetical protein
MNTMKLASALAEISIQATRQCKEDYLYELVSIASALEEGREYVLTSRSTGADPMRRFGEYKTLEEGITLAKKSLGVDCVFVFQPSEEYGFSIDIVNVNLEMSTMFALTNGLDCRGIKFNVVK